MSVGSITGFCRTGEITARGKCTVDNGGKRGINTAMSSLSPLMNLIDAYGALTELPDVTISFRVFGDSKKIAALRGGGDITTSRLDHAVRWFSDKWPEGAEWPEGIDRPARVDVQNKRHGDAA